MTDIYEHPTSGRLYVRAHRDGSVTLRGPSQLMRDLITDAELAHEPDLGPEEHQLALWHRVIRLELEWAEHLRRVRMLDATIRDRTAEGVDVPDTLREQLDEARHRSVRARLAAVQAHAELQGVSA